MAAQQSEGQTELDRLWAAIDSANQHIQDLERRSVRAVPPVVTQLAQCSPAPDYRIGEPVAQVVDAQWPDVDTSHGVAAPVEGPCGCEEATALQVRVAELEAGNAELSRRIVNQAAAHDLPRVQDVAEIHGLKASVAELEAETKELDRAHRFVLNQRNEAQDECQALRGRILELESALAQATARASTAPASQADILCVEQVQTTLGDRVDDLSKRVLRLEALIEEPGA